jgi:hypothetical protein
MQQLKWLASGTVVTIGVGVAGSSLIPGALGQVLSVAIVALPVSIGVGILRYRLYEIDRIISRTLPMPSSPACWPGCMRAWCCWPPGF